FVADYSELRNLSVSEAVEKIGLSMDDIVGVSAIIFPITGRPLYPANARGVLQVVSNIDHEHANDPATEYRRFDGLATKIAPSELADHSIPSYGWEQFKQSYLRFCRLAQEFRCAETPYSAATRFGTLSRDWHPLGFARQTKEDPCNSAVDLCSTETAKWDDVVKKQIKEQQIARVFLIDNYAINSIPGRYMVDFDNPKDQKIID